MKQKNRTFFYCLLLGLLWLGPAAEALNYNQVFKIKRTLGLASYGVISTIAVEKGVYVVHFKILDELTQTVILKKVPMPLVGKGKSIGTVGAEPLSRDLDYAKFNASMRNHHEGDRVSETDLLLLNRLKNADPEPDPLSDYKVRFNEIVRVRRFSSNADAADLVHADVYEFIK